jgi:ABC-type Fe3+ transport system permease subunit
VACAIWELAITLLPWCLVIFFQSRDIHAFGRVTKDFGSQARGRRGMGFLQAAAAFLFFLPYLSVLTRQGHWSSDEIMPALKISLELAGVTAFGALLTALAAVVFLESLPSPWRGLRAVVTFLMGLPTGISVLVLGLGLWLAYGKWIDPFSGSFLAIAALQIVIFFPIAFRVLWPVARDRQVRLLEAATTLGASRVRAYWTVEWPRWKPPLVSALGMVAGASLGEVAAVSLFYSENLIPLPLLISRWSAQYRFADAQSVAVLLLFLCSGVILLAYPFAYPVKRTRK